MTPKHKGTGWSGGKRRDVPRSWRRSTARSESMTVATGGFGPAFLIFGGVALVAAVICAGSVLETRNRTFEEISP